MTQHRPQQLSIDLPKPRVGWGGRRRGAGRKRGPKSGVMHRARQWFDRPRVAHVTLRVVEDVPNLRSCHEVFGVVWQALLASAWGPCCEVERNRNGFRLVHFTVQGNHLHLVVEAAHSKRLSRGMHALKVRVAKRINGLLKRKGAVFTERYHVRFLKTPTEVRNVLCYVLNNTRRHWRGRPPRATWVDPQSSARWFNGWRTEVVPHDDNPLPAARTFLLRKGWRRGRGGLIDTHEVPGDVRRE
ncbi:MAG: transposase [Myxococcales bacterium]|nr:transposase [Myxococcales bacterium]